MQAIAIAEIDGGHADAAPPIIPPVILLDLAAPELADGRGAVLPETDVDQEIGVLEGGHEVGGRGGAGPALDAGGQQGGSVPAV